MDRKQQTVRKAEVDQNCMCFNKNCNKSQTMKRYDICLGLKSTIFIKTFVTLLSRNCSGVWVKEKGEVVIPCCNGAQDKMTRMANV